MSTMIQHWKLTEADYPASATKDDPKVDVGIDAGDARRRPDGASDETGLVARELQVLQLLCTGLRNFDIAARIHQSVGTVDPHVAAILDKLGIDSRLDAGRRAAHDGWFRESLG